jgi:hypothetical protein
MDVAILASPEFDAARHATRTFVRSDALAGLSVEYGGLACGDC